MNFSTSHVRYRLPLLFALLAVAPACKEDPAPLPPAPAPRSSTPVPSNGPQAGPHSTETPPQEAPDPEDPPPPHPGPWLWVQRSSAGVYQEAKADKDRKVGYVQIGGRVPVLTDRVQGEGCSKGWYKLASGGFICSLVGTTDANDPVAKFPPRQPKLDDILPYPYMRNAHNGTPLYRSLPSRDQMYQYEPYLPDAKKAKEGGEGSKGTAALGWGGQTGLSASEPEPPRWWESGENLHEVKLERLSEDADGILAKRMVKGFYIAVDKTFPWNGRSWYKTTKGLVAPADRFWRAAASEFQGVELDGEKWSLPVAWVHGANKEVTTYEIDEETKKIKPAGTLKRFEAAQLTEEMLSVGGKDYRKTAAGTWVKASQVRSTTPEKRPEGVGPSERWIDVDISQQTLVVFDGDTPIYATLVSSGKESKVKDKDHSTPRGMWRVREKHLVTTMDGDGSAAGDLPYSIEDVPYVMYFHKAYATHGAFWHQNFGSQMSHGCVNLAPLDAKWIFFHAEPRLPEGLHGVWSSAQQPGSMVVVHD